MKGLLYKDLLLLWKSHKREILFYLAIQLALALYFRSVDFLLLTLYAASGAIPAAFGVEDANGWTTYARALPVTPTQTALSKYLANLCLVLPSAAVCYALIRAFSLGDTAAGDMTLLLFTLCFAQLLFCVEIPLCFRYGREQGTHFFLVTVLCAVFVLDLASHTVFATVSVSHRADTFSKVVQVIEGRGDLFEALTAYTARCGLPGWWPAAVIMAAVYAASLHRSVLACRARD